MSESERRRKYRYDRVLIETARVLSSTFDDAVVFLSGVQLEMLRNVTQYLRRLETYVSEYNPGYYLTPTIADYDDILAIVADLEETLMGNPNTIWGYADTYSARPNTEKTETGTFGSTSHVVPAGYVYVLTSISIMFTSGTCDAMYIYSHLDEGDILIARDNSPAVNVPLSVQGHFPLKAGHYSKSQFVISAQPCHIWSFFAGYSMKVPD